MRQLLLDLGAEKPQTMDTFVEGQNAELLQLLQLFVRRAPRTPSERFVYVWGDPGAGKTHLLRALETDATARYIATGSPIDAYLFEKNVTLYLLDDCERLSADAPRNPSCSF